MEEYCLEKVDKRRKLEILGIKNATIIQVNTD